VYTATRAGAARVTGVNVPFWRNAPRPEVVAPGRATIVALAARTLPDLPKFGRRSSRSVPTRPRMWRSARLNNSPARRENAAGAVRGADEVFGPSWQHAPSSLRERSHTVRKSDADLPGR
jgi:hypothetical protein